MPSQSTDQYLFSISPYALPCPQPPQRKALLIFVTDETRGLDSHQVSESPCLSYSVLGSLYFNLSSGKKGNALANRPETREPLLFSLLAHKTRYATKEINVSFLGKGC